jgi:hypothetical protein
VFCVFLFVLFQKLAKFFYIQSCLAKDASKGSLREIFIVDWNGYPQLWILMIDESGMAAPLVGNKKTGFFKGF